MQSAFPAALRQRLSARAGMGYCMPLQHDEALLERLASPAMSGDPCAAHPQEQARFRCDGCARLLCDACIEESHRLLLCRHCGERALPLVAAMPATTEERRRAQSVVEKQGYGLAQALVYPFRGGGLLMFVVAVLSAGAVGVFVFFARYSIGTAAISFWIAWVAMLVGIQFEIVASTAEYHDELPDWPEYFSLGERLTEILTFLVIATLHYGPLAIFVFVFAPAALLGPPRLLFWIGAAAALWIGTALAVMAWGAAALHWRHSALRVDRHLRALAATGGDGLATVNVTFVLVGLVAVTRALGAGVPVVGTAVAGVIGIYWTFVAPHLVGLLFRRHGERIRGIYEPHAP